MSGALDRHEAAGHATSASVGGGTYTFGASYDVNTRLSSLSVSNSSTSALLFQSQRGYDAASNVTSVGTTLSAGTDNQVFCYDEQNRLVWAGSTGTPSCGSSLTTGSLSSASYTQTFGYDTLDRLTSGALGGYSYGDSAHLHAVTSIGSGPTYTAKYDAVGDMTCRAPDNTTTCAGTPPETGAQLGYDNEGRLATWQNTPTSPTTTDSFLYDGAGNRVEQSVTINGSMTTTTTYVAGGLEEMSDNGTGTTVTKYFSTDGLPTAERVGTNGPLSYLATDGQSTIAESLDISGNVTSSQLYTPYGNARYSSSTSPTTHGFTGQRYDGATGLDYYVARYYDPVAGQFVSADTVNDGLNRYGYVKGNPETAIDPTGHRFWAPDGFGSDFEQWLIKMAAAKITGGTFISPKVKNAANVGGEQTVKGASALAVMQNNMGGVNAKTSSGRKIPTMGLAVVYVSKWNTWDNAYDFMEAVPLGPVTSSGGDGPEGHAEGNIMNEILNWIQNFQNKVNSNFLDRLGEEIDPAGEFQFTFDMVIAQGPCRNCGEQKTFDKFVAAIGSALGHLGRFTFNWDYLQNEGKESTDPNVGPSASVLKTWQSANNLWWGQ